MSLPVVDVNCTRSVHTRKGQQLRMFRVPVPPDSSDMLSRIWWFGHRRGFGHSQLLHLAFCLPISIGELDALMTLTRTKVA